MTAWRNSGPGGIGCPSLSLRFLLKMEGKTEEIIRIISDTLSLQSDSGVLEGKQIVNGVQHLAQKERPHRDNGELTCIRYVVCDVNHLSKGLES